MRVLTTMDGTGLNMEDSRILGFKPWVVASLFGLLQAGVIAALVLLFFEEESVRTMGVALAVFSGVLLAIALKVLFEALD